MAVACASALAKAKAHGGGGDACQPTKAQMHAALDGNLCRCTGYRPIIDAATVRDATGWIWVCTP
jgi:xanthine dehydrogenase iron-sulfur cluster and FAD-binding subunit A